MKITEMNLLMHLVSIILVTVMYHISLLSLSITSSLSYVSHAVDTEPSEHSLLYFLHYLYSPLQTSCALF